MNLANFKTKLIRNQKSKTDSNLDNSDIKKEPKLVTSELNSKQQDKEPEILSKRPSEKNLLSQLTEIYDTCKEIEDTELVEIISSLPIPIKTKNITNILMSIVAKRTALDCMQFGVPRIPTLMRIVPAIDMLDADLPSLAEKEYHQIKLHHMKHNNKYHGYGEKEKQIIKILLLENIAKLSAKSFDRTGDFNLPQSDKLRNLNTEDLALFINSFETSCTEELSENDRKRLSRELRGEVTAELQDINKILKKMNPTDKDIAIEEILNLLRTRINETNQKTDEQIKLDKTLAEITTKIQQLPSNKQLSTAETILNVLDHQQEAMNLWANCKKSESVR